MTDLDQPNFNDDVDSMIKEVIAWAEWQVLCGSRLVQREHISPEPKAERKHQPSPKASRLQNVPTVEKSVVSPSGTRDLPVSWQGVVSAPKGSVDVSNGNCKACRSVMSPGVGTGESGLMIITVEPFLDGAAEMLDRMLSNVLGVRRHTMCVFQAHLCTSHVTGQAKDPSCRGMLLSELSRVNPRVLLALGRGAAEAVFAQQSQTCQRGEWSQLRFNEVQVPTMVSFHPSFLIRDPSHRRAAFEDLTSVRRVMDGSTSDS